MNPSRYGQTVLCLAFLLLGAVFGGAQQEPHPRRIVGFVPTEKVALAVGEAILRGIEGDDYVEMYKPLRARKIGGFWVIDGLAEKIRGQLVAFEEAKLAIDPANGAVVLYGLMPDEIMLKRLKLLKPIVFPKPNVGAPGKASTSSLPKPAPTSLAGIVYLDFRIETNAPVTTVNIWSDGTDVTARVRKALPEIECLLRSGKPGGRFLDGSVRLGARTGSGETAYVDRHGTVLRKGKTSTLSKTAFARLGALMPSAFPLRKARQPRITTGSELVGG